MTQTGGIRWLVGIGLRFVATLFAVLALYMIAAAAGAVLRPGGAAPAAGETYPVLLIWSDIHTDLILPAQGVSVDWQAVLLNASSPAGLGDAGYFAFGWGSESFYTSAPTMADVTVGLVARALFFDTTVVHVAPAYDPEQIPPAQRLTIRLSAEQLAALEQHVLRSFALSTDGKAEPLIGETYGYGDAFYHANGRYNPIGTCNQWTSDALRLAGVSAGYWTPFSQSLIWVLGTDADRAASQGP